jgi:hypothetical protein
MLNQLQSLLRALEAGVYNVRGYPFPSNCPCQHPLDKDWKSHSLFCTRPTDLTEDFWAINRTNPQMMGLSAQVLQVESLETVLKTT